MKHSEQNDACDGPPPGRWLHRLTVLAVCLVWPLIWVGGLVTTYDAGMAVPDWPATYGYNLFLYPYKSWLLGPFDLFIEHGHRLLGAVVGFVAIGIVIAAFRSEPRKWVRWLSVALLLAVIAQGLLGGIRVLLSDRSVAMIHGCFGPAFFALCVLLAVVTSRGWWRSAKVMDNRQPVPGRGLVAVVTVLLAIAYGQLLMGAQLRHLHADAQPGWFAMVVSLHVMMAFLLWALCGLVWFRLRRCGDLTLSRPGKLLIGLVALQIVLGIGTWVVNYGWPSFLQWLPGSKGYLIHAKGFIESAIVTAHVATGSLILAVCTMILVRTLRSRHRRTLARIQFVDSVSHDTAADSATAAPATI